MFNRPPFCFSTLCGKNGSSERFKMADSESDDAEEQTWKKGDKRRQEDSDEDSDEEPSSEAHSDASDESFDENMVSIFAF